MVCITDLSNLENYVLELADFKVKTLSVDFNHQAFNYVMVQSHYRGPGQYRDWYWHNKKQCFSGVLNLLNFVSIHASLECCSHSASQWKSVKLLDTKHPKSNKSSTHPLNPLSVIYCRGITRIHQLLSRPRPSHKADSRSH